MQLITETQVSPIESEVLARISIIRPILTSLLFGIKMDVLQEFEGIEKIKNASKGISAGKRGYRILL